jgi:hypothetical protein
MKCYFHDYAYLQVCFVINLAFFMSKFNDSRCQSMNKIIFLKFTKYKYYIFPAMWPSTGMFLPYLVQDNQCTTGHEAGTDLLMIQYACLE